MPQLASPWGQSISAPLDSLWTLLGLMAPRLRGAPPDQCLQPGLEDAPFFAAVSGELGPSGRPRCNPLSLVAPERFLLSPRVLSQMSVSPSSSGACDFFPVVPLIAVQLLGPESESALSPLATVPCDSSPSRDASGEVYSPHPQDLHYSLPGLLAKSQPADGPVPATVSCCDCMKASPLAAPLRPFQILCPRLSGVREATAGAHRCLAACLQQSGLSPIRVVPGNSQQVSQEQSLRCGRPSTPSQYPGCREGGVSTPTPPASSH